MPGKVLWLLIVAGGAMALAGIIMRRSPNPALYGKAGIIGWSGIAIALLARILLGIRQRTQPSPKKRS